MDSLDILCSNPLNLKNKLKSIEHRKIFCGPSKILKNISSLINICLRYFINPTKTLPPFPPSCIINVRSLIPNFDEFFTIKQLKKIKYKYCLATHVEIINLLKS